MFLNILDKAATAKNPIAQRNTVCVIARKKNVEKSVVAWPARIHSKKN